MKRAVAQMAALLFCVVLGACHAPLVALVPAGVVGVGGAITASSTLTTTVVVLTDAERAACDGQKVANDFSDLARHLGWSRTASDASAASKIFGLACIW